MRDITNFIKIQPQTVSWLNQEMINNKLFIDNSFQRRYVWVLKDKVKLIETILLGFTINEWSIICKSQCKRGDRIEDNFF